MAENVAQDRSDAFPEAEMPAKSVQFVVDDTATVAALTALAKQVSVVCVVNCEFRLVSVR